MKSSRLGNRKPIKSESRSRRTGSPRRSGDEGKQARKRFKDQISGLGINVQSKSRYFSLIWNNLLM